MKKYLIVYYGDAPECVEGFHKDCERSCKGALHVKPGRQMTVTEDELKHLKESKKCSHMVPKLRVLGEKGEDPKREEPKSESEDSKESEDEQPSDEEPAPQEGSKPETKAQKKKRLREEKKAQNA